FEDSVGDAVLELVPPRHQGRPRRRTGGADVEVRETDALSVQAIEVRRLQDGIAVARQVAVALVIGEKKDNVGPACRQRGGGLRRGLGAEGRGQDSSEASPKACFHSFFSAHGSCLPAEICPERNYTFSPSEA